MNLEQISTQELQKELIKRDKQKVRDDKENVRIERLEKWKN